MYHCEFANVSTFVRHLTVHCIARGYRFYITGKIPEGKDPHKTDLKIIGHYNVDISKWARSRRKRRGLANVQYLRCGSFFVLLATRGVHRFFEEEPMFKDIRRQPLWCFGSRIYAAAPQRGERGRLLIRRGV